MVCPQQISDSARIFLSKASGGLDIPSITTCFKKAQVSRYSQLMAFIDSKSCFLAERKHACDTGTHKKLKPTEEVIATMQEYPNATRSRLASEARKRVASTDERALNDHASSSVKEGHLFGITEKGDELWSDTTLSLSEHRLAFAMEAAIDSLPHNTNLSTWRKLNSDLCPICLKLGQQNRQTLAVEVRILDTNSLQPLFMLSKTSVRDQRTLMKQIAKAAMEDSHAIWALRNQ